MFVINSDQGSYNDHEMPKFLKVNKKKKKILWVYVVQAHDGEKLKVDSWVAVAYDEGFYIGQITSLSDGKVNVNFLARRKDGQYRWPKRKDSAIISTEYIFCAKLRVQKVGNSFVVLHETSISTSYQAYKKKYM